MDGELRTAVEEPRGWMSAPVEPSTFNNFSERTTTRWGNILFGRVFSKRMNVVNRHLTARIANLFLAPASLLPCAIDTIAGLQAGALSIVTLGLDNHTVNFAARELYAIGDLVSKPFECLVRALNPRAVFPRRFVRHDSDIQTAISDIPVAGKLGNAAARCAYSKAFFAKHITSRVLYALTAVTAVVCRVALGVLAVPTAVLSVATFGCVPAINRVANIGLRAPAIINDLAMCAIKVINPQAGEPC